MTSKTTATTRSLNFLTNTRAAIEIHAAPDITFNCNSFNVPGVTTNSAPLSTPFTTVPIRGDTLVYEPLSLTFIVNEDLSNWRLGLTWMKGITAPESGEQFRNKKIEYSDATVYIYNSHHNMEIEVHFSGLTPTSLGGLRFDTNSEGVVEIVADMSFDYQHYTIESIRPRT